jgi:hypothetical protein
MASGGWEQHGGGGDERPHWEQHGGEGQARGRLSRTRACTSRDFVGARARVSLRGVRRLCATAAVVSAFLSNLGSCALRDAHASPSLPASAQAPPFFEALSEMHAYFSRVTAAVVNYSPSDAAAIARELQQLGARVVPHYARDAVTHLITPYATGDDYAAAVRDGGVAVVSYAWLEDCLAARRVLPRDAKVLYAPIRDARGVPGMAGCVLAACGYGGAARSDLRELADAAGCAFSGSLTRASTHLLCYRPESEVYAAALLARLEGRDVAVVNHRWLEDSVRAWRRQPEGAPPYARLGCEVDADARVAAERDARAAAEAEAAAALARAAQLEQLLGAEGEARRALDAALAEAHAREAHLAGALHGEGAAREAEAARAAESRGDTHALQALLAAAEGARAQLQAQLLAADEERRGAGAAAAAAAAQQRELTTAFARSRGDLLTQLEARQGALEAAHAQLAAAHAAHAATRDALEAERRASGDAAAALRAEAARAAALTDAAAAAARDRGALSKQLEAERRSRLHALADFETERRQREHLLRQLDAEQRLRASLQAAVGAKEALRAAAEAEVARLQGEARATEATVARLRAFEPPTRTGAFGAGVAAFGGGGMGPDGMGPDGDEQADGRVAVKLFLDGGDDIRFLELDADARHDALLASVGRALAESHRITHEDADGHRVTLRGQEDLDVALRAFARSGVSYFKISAERASAAAERTGRNGRGLLRGWRSGGGKAPTDAGSEAGGDAGRDSGGGGGGGNHTAMR